MWVPQKGPQLAAIEADWCDELFYGGERGGGKSDYQLGYQEDGVLQYGKFWRGIMFRKTYPELEELQARASEVFPGEGAVYKTQPSADFPFSNCWYWPSGATVKMRFIENEKDYGKYHGHQYTGISFDEVTEYASPAGLLKMLSTLRSAHGVPCTVRLTGNPGGIGHVWVKGRYIDACAPRVPYLDPETGFTRMFVPSRMADNQILMQADPGYRSRILAATGGNEALRKAWLEGDWNIVAGAFFENWRSALHVIPRFTPPKHWTRGRSMDWGSAHPFSVGWWCVAEDEWVKLSDGSERKFPAGALIRYREWYGVERDQAGNPNPNVGLRMDVELIAKGIMQREEGETINEQMSPAGTDMWKSEGGPSFAERMAKIQNMTGPRFRPADTGRVQGWQQVRQRLNGEDGKPMLYVTEDCRDFIRTFPALQNDAHKLEDVDSDGEDHIGDECFVAGTIVETLAGPRRIEELVGTDPMLVGPSGAPLPAMACRLTKRGAEVVRLTFEDGSEITCTPSHRFETPKGWTKARDTADVIRYNGIWSKSYPRQNSAIEASLITSAAGTSSAKVFGCTKSSTPMRRGLSLMGSMFTILTKIGQTISQPTLSACQKVSMVDCMVRRPALVGEVPCRPREQPPLRGMDRMSARSGTGGSTSATAPLSCISAQRCSANSVPSTLPVLQGLGSVLTSARVHGAGIRVWMTSMCRALFAPARSEEAGTPLPRLAPQNAGSSWQTLRVLRVEPAGRADVYCMTVPGASAFMVEGGISVHNCRYMCMARPWSTVKKPRQMTGPKAWSLDWVIQQDEERKRRPQR